MFQDKEVLIAPKDAYSFGGCYVDVSDAIFEGPEVRGSNVHVQFSGSIFFSPDDHLGLQEQWFKNGEIVFSNVQEFKQILAINNPKNPATYEALVVLLVPLKDAGIPALFPPRYFAAGRVTHPSEGYSIYMISRCESVTINGKLEFDGQLLSPTEIRNGSLKVEDWPYG